MKNICLSLSLLFYSLSYSQNNDDQRISLVSPNRDTLWLLNNETGNLIAYSWNNYKDTPEQKKPVIL